MYFKRLKFGIGGNSYPMECVLTGSEDPVSTVEGNVGQLYYNTETGEYWRCASDEGGDYQWEPFGGVAFDEVVADPETGYLHFLKDGEDVVDPCYIGNMGGGGGGGSGNNAVVTVTNMTGWLSKTINLGADCVLTFEWSSIEGETETGDGTLTVKVNGNTRRTTDISQGVVTVNVKDYLTAGTNKIKLSVADVYDNTKSLNFTIRAAELKMTSQFDYKQYFAAGQTVPFTYTPYGSVEKTVIFSVDGAEAGRQTVTTSGRQQTFTLPAMTHGAHRVTAYYTAQIEGETVESNRLDYDLIVVDSTSAVPIIASDFRETSARQFETLSVPYRVYTPGSLTSAVELYRGETKVSSVTVDRGDQVWNRRENEAGEHAYSIKSGTAARTFTVTFEKSDIDVEAEEDALALYLTSAGRSNAEEHPEVWQDAERDISCVLTGFNFVSDGWMQDGDGVTVLRVNGGARVEIPYQPFAQDFRSTGKTIELEFASRNILNYDAVLISCMSGGRGFELTAQRAMLKSEQSEIDSQYKEDEHIRIAFVAEKRAENRLLMIYINGILSGVVQYPEDDDFSQQTPVNITIGSNDCTTDIYCIRVYDNGLTRYQVLGNWIADTQDIETLLRRYEHNAVYDEYGSVVIANLPDDLPYLVISGPELPQSKGDKKTVAGYFVDPVYASRSFSFTDAQIDVQGTSSQYYPRKNYKVKFKGGFVMTQGGAKVSTYKLRDGAIPVDTFCFKADVASSEGANNVELARLYDAACPYRTPAQKSTDGVRQGIDGFPIVIFWDNGEAVSFIGKYNFNNDKGTAEVFGFTDGDESWEIKNNTSERVIWKNADYTGSGWLNDFEARFPDLEPPYADPAQLAEFAAWVKSTDRDAATDAALPDPVTYGETTYTHDTADYRLAKFKAEAGRYMEIDSALFYYLFTEIFLMVDSRAKNAFPSFIGQEVI